VQDMGLSLVGCANCCRLSRSILADKPRVTRFFVEFDPVEGVSNGFLAAHAAPHP
jgi:hypothetical protein